jgi:ubiquinone/menaquinone biosynthesis C-methylase UbiE
MNPQPLQAQKQAVPGEFDRVARRYDLLTGMNPGYRKHLRWSAERMQLVDGPGLTILDLCCGTGLSTEPLVKTYPRAQISGLDASAGMLAVAAKKPWARAVRFVCGDAMDPAASGLSGPFDGILMAYGIRNMPDPDLCLGRLFNLLKPGGTICFHEYSVRDSRRSRIVWNAVALGIIIPAGLLTSPGSDIYRYLRASVNDFDGVAAFEARLAQAGFTGMHTHTMDGWQTGIVHSFIARRPA